MSKYEYYIEEYSQDSRNYEIKCDWQLTESQITELYQEAGIPERWQKELEKDKSLMEDKDIFYDKGYIAGVSYVVGLLEEEE